MRGTQITRFCMSGMDVFSGDGVCCKDSLVCVSFREIGVTEIVVSVIFSASIVEASVSFKRLIESINIEHPERKLQKMRMLKIVR